MILFKPQKMHLLNNIKSKPFNYTFGTILFFIMSIQYVPIEGMTVSPVKVSMMMLSLLVFFNKVPFLSKAFWYCIIYWIVCFSVALMHHYFRFSTLAYLALFLTTYIVFYNIVNLGTFELKQFKQLLRILILSYFTILCIQQIFVCIGLNSLSFINLHTNSIINKLPALACEPSHTARIITAAMLGYIRCLELEQKCKINIKFLFNPENRIVTIGFLWLILTMGSGTGLIATGILCLYFLNLRNVFIILPSISILLFILNYFENAQLERVLNILTVLLNEGNNTDILLTDSSASTRIVPLLNTLKINLNDITSWIGEGTMSEYVKNSWADMTQKTPVIEQYGLLGLFASLILFYKCAVRNFFSIETLYFIFIALLTLANGYVTWSMMYIFTAIRYFQAKKENGCLDNHSKL